MAKVYTWEFAVRTYELDEYGHVNNAVYQNYLEEGATQASASNGFDFDWYFEHRTGWVVRKMTARYLQPLTYGDRARLHTWVSDFRRVRSHREYDLRRASDDTPVLRARADWVFVNLDTMRPERIPDAFMDAFQPTGDVEPIEVHLTNPTVFPNAPQYVMKRTVQHYELDPAGHVNNSVYLHWSEEAMFNALNTAGWPVQRMLAENFAMVQGAREIEYFRPARYGEPITIISQPTELQRVRGAWVHEMRHSETDELIARDYSVGVFLDLATNRPREMLQPMVDDLLNWRPVEI